jgi:hypothetical protein
MAKAKTAKTKTETATEGALRIWHIPQVPGPAFRVSVATPREGALLLHTLADYDRFQYENRIKPDYCNAQGLEVFEDGEWCEWCDEQGDDIGEASENLLRAE